MNTLAFEAGRKIERRRSSRNERKSEVARATGIDRLKIWRIESGIQQLDITDAWRLADHFNCSIDDLIGRSPVDADHRDQVSAPEGIPDQVKQGMEIILEARRHGAMPRLNMLGALQMALEAIRDPAVTKTLSDAAVDHKDAIVRFLKWENAQPLFEAGIAR